MKSPFCVILFALACALPASAHGEEPRAAAPDRAAEAGLRARCEAEAKSLQTPDEEFDAYVEVCIEDLKKQPGGPVKHQPVARTAD